MSNHPTQVTAADAVSAALRRGSDANPLVKWKVAHVDRRNLNGRIYTRSLFEKVCREAKRPQAPSGRSDLANGRITFRLDHPDALSQGWLGKTCGAWRDLWVEADGAVFGVVEVFADTEPGRHVIALLDNGATCGASISGRGKARHPTADERARFGLPSQDDEEDAVDRDGTPPSVVFDDSDECGYALLAIDGVDTPAVADAFAEPGIAEQDVASAGELLLDAVAKPGVIGGPPLPERRSNWFDEQFHRHFGGRLPGAPVRDGGDEQDTLARQLVRAFGPTLSDKQRDTDSDRMRDPIIALFRA